MSQDMRARAAIARAAQATGVDFQYLMAQAQLESGLDPAARAGTSSAAGLFQFTDGTWLGTLDRHGADHGMGWVAGVIEGGKVRDGGLRQQILGLRYNADASALMAAELARDNRAELTGVLGRDPDASELYMAHFLGSAGARTFFQALAANPQQSAAALLPRAAAANSAIFYGAGGASRSVGEVMALVRGRMASALGMGDAAGLAGPGGLSQAVATASNLGPVAREFQAARASIPAPAAPVAPALASAPVGRSMADTLRSAFGASGAALPANVQSAYGRLARFGL